MTMSVPARLPALRSGILRALAIVIICGLALTGGLVSALSSGRVEPLAWALPCTVALVVLGWALRWRGIAWPWLLALTCLPVLALIVPATNRVPWVGLATLAGLLGLTALVISQMRGRSTAPRALAGTVLVITALLAPLATRSVPRLPSQRVAILSGIPLQGAPLGEALRLPPMQAVGLESPSWQALAASLGVRPLDAIKPAAIHSGEALLLVQPRALAPQELVALDAWVRSGGRAVILADPLLHWPDPRPLGHPSRAPLTSLLDPLLAHWGLRLEPAEMIAGSDEPERRDLQSGALLQLRGASHFSSAHAVGPCALIEAGLIARCLLGRGEALLVADADWLDDALWTMAPGQPTDRSAWTSDAVDQLAAWLSGSAFSPSGYSSWLGDETQLRRGVRQALAMLLTLAVVQGAASAFPILPHHFRRRKQDQKANIGETGPGMS